MPKKRDSAREKPSPHKLKKARQRGELAFSRELSSVSAAVACALVLYLAGPHMVSRLLVFGRTCFSGGSETAWRSSLDLLLNCILLVGGCSAAAALVMGLAQAGFKLSLRPSLKRMDPVGGLGRLVSRDRLVDLAWLLVRLAVLLCVACFSVWDWPSLFAAGAGTDLARACMPPAQAISELGLSLLACALALALVDRVIQKRRFMAGQGMTRQEVVQERKEQQGDPAVRSERRKRHRQLLAGGLDQLGRARVVVVNPTHAAAALAYDREQDQAPVVLVAGWGGTARRIRQRARELGLPILEQVPLARALAQVPWGQEIPEELYQAAAEVITSLEELA